VRRRGTAALRYATDRLPGLRRRRDGDGFVYERADGTPIEDRVTLDRIARLAIPPAWKNVWIAPDPRFHVQATGRDARRRKQYRYHALWQQLQSARKFDRMAEVGAALPRLRRKVSADLRRPGLPRERVLALVVALIDRSGGRVGNREYQRSNGSFGLTTLLDRHLAVRGSRLVLEFRGKSGVPQRLEVDDRRLAKLARRCQELPGQTLFQYVAAPGRLRALTSQEVNAYLRRAAALEISTKDLRTWQGSATAIRHLCAAPSAMPTWNETVAAVARELGNTKAVCRNHYLHPGIEELAATGELAALWARASARGGLAREEHVLLAVARRRPRALAA
jgi:DNA topoisomerase-1